MKSKFTTVDIIAMVAELNERLAGMRVVQVYDTDHKTYLFKLQRPEQKAVLLLESGARIHATEYEWPKNPAPSGFSMKLRKHIRNKRLESIRQLGVDRVVDLQFGSGEVAHHVILELYDRGNLVLTDHQYTILNILRPRTDAESVRFASKENYPLDKARLYETRSEQQLREVLSAAKEGDVLKKIINPHLDFGAALIEHLLLEAGFPAQARLGHEFHIEEDMHRLVAAIRAGEAVLRNEQQDFKGIVTYRVERRSAGGQKGGQKGGSDAGGDTEMVTYQEFHPLLYAQHADQPHHTFLSFTAAVDEFFSKLESQKLDMKAVQQEREALKKLDNVRRDHQRRLEALELAQRDDRWRAELITSNAQLVDGAALVVRSALANQIDWREIGRIVQEAQKRGDPVARSIKALKLETNHITMLLHDPYQEESDEDEEDGSEDGREDAAPPAEKADQSSHIRPMLVDIDLDLSALANATRYFGQKRTAAKKQQKTIESSFKAMKSAEQKTKQTLKEAATIASINKARRVHWFERFLWFISSENYLVLGGRDQQQNEILVRRYLKPGDIYVHGDLHGAASLVVKNPTGAEVPPKTLNEAGSFAVCNSSAWDAKIVTSAWWVHAHQVSKTAPTGEYLTTGSFMVRGKKNYLPPCQLTLGFAVLFKLEESSIERHRGERRVRTVESEDGPRPVPAAEEPSSAAGDEDGAQEDGAASSQDGEDEKEDSGEKDSEDEKEEKKDDSEEEEKEEKTDSKEEEEKDSAEEDAKGESEEENEFPDTNVEVKHLKGSKFTVEVTSPTDSRPADNPFPKLPGPKPAAARRGGKKPTGPPPAGKEKKQNCAPPPQPRGKRSKMKRAKEKYKDQDDEEREARMAILQVTVPQDCQILEELTGLPVEEDELLYAVPVCAPWSTVLGYKFKVKLTPSAGKKGKAAKTAVQSFLTDKAATPRERDLIKSVRLEDVTRNFPGRVKVVLPQAARAKKK
ncbi:Nuclear export mediator factor Nemf [Amphibalanus amphitrite]|uniref:Nuclear export mediator factor Nemf n=1 Tax=Amphibalanus amphitrite TaxID=1232801 RepID=A0A6A4VPC8_AMPAM|nr:Nuclear export mediator factor Nemf [Amphibalanus amphitrite]KAF0296436.1 Nuclear export mediator factor Nemf [Amphibalanus amphitrite]